MPKIDIDVELNTSGVTSSARSAANAAGDAIDSELASAGKSGGDAAGDRIESGVEGGARSGAKTAGSAIDSEVTSAGRSAGDAAGSAIEAGVEAGGEAGADGAASAIESVASVAKAAFAAISVDAVVGGISDLSARAAEAQTYMSRLEASARQNSVSAEAMGSTYSSLVGVLGETDRTVETAGNMFALCGDNQERLQQLTTSLTGAYSQFGDGMPIEALAEAANETVKVGTVTGSFADALNWVSASTDQWSAALSGNSAAQAAFNAALDQGMSKEDAFNAALAACSDEGERAQIVTDALNALYGEAGATYEDANADLIAYNQSQDAASTAMAELGDTLMPVQTGFNDVATAVAERAQPALDWLVNEAGPWLLDNLPTIVPILVAIAAGFAGWQVISFIQGVPAMLSSLQVAIQGVNAAMSANPIGVVVALISGLVAAIMYLWTTNEGFRDAVTSVFSAIGSFVSGIVSAIVGFFTQTVPGAIGDLIARVSQMPGEFASFLGSVLSNVVSWVGSMASNALSAGSQFLSNVVGYISGLPGRIWEFLSGAIGKAASFVSDFASKAIEAATQFKDNIVNGIKSIPDRVMSIGSDIVHGIWSGISGAGDWLMDQISGFAGGIVDGIKGFFGIASPSKVMRREVGRWIPAGIAEGIGDEAGDISDAMGEAVGVALDAAGGLVLGAPALGAGAALSGLSATRESAAAAPVTQEINFNQPVQTPSQLARTMRMYSRYGLAGVM